MRQPARLRHRARPARRRPGRRHRDVRRRGVRRDAALLFSDWGFALSDVRCPTQLWYGAHDDRNPPATGQWWADRITGAELTVTPTSHLATLLANWQTILAALRSYLD